MTTMFFPLRHLIAFMAWAFVTTSALADDWIAQQLRGPVLRLVGNQWQPLQRGMVLPDGQLVRTLGSGQVTLIRGGETLELGPNTQIQIHDKTGTKPFTTVRQYFG